MVLLFRGENMENEGKQLPKIPIAELVVYRVFRAGGNAC